LILNLVAASGYAAEARIQALQLRPQLGDIVRSAGTNRFTDVHIINADGKTNRFYFSYAGYIRPAGNLGISWFWSSSVIQKVADYALDLVGYDGVLGPYYKNRKQSVRVLLALLL
jgi:hypothetical protein